MIVFLKVRCGMTWAEIGQTSLPQAQMLLAGFGESDGHREAARFLVDSLVDLAVAGGLVKRSESGKRKPQPASPPAASSASRSRPEPPHNPENDGGILIPELAEAMKKMGWTAPGE